MIILYHIGTYTLWIVDGSRTESTTKYYILYIKRIRLRYRSVYNNTYTAQLQCRNAVCYINDNTCARLPIRAAVECAAGKRKAKRLSSLPPSDLFFKVYYTKVPLSACRRRRRRRMADIAPVPLRVLTHIYVYSRLEFFFVFWETSIILTDKKKKVIGCRTSWCRKLLLRDGNSMCNLYI